MEDNEIVFQFGNMKIFRRSIAHRHEINIWKITYYPVYESNKYVKKTTLEKYCIYI